METIKNKSGNRYRELFRIDGRTIKSPTFKRKSDAKAWKNRKESEKATLFAHGTETNLNIPYTFAEYANK